MIPLHHATAYFSLVEGEKEFFRFTISSGNQPLVTYDIPIRSLGDFMARRPVTGSGYIHHTCPATQRAETDQDAGETGE